MPTRAGGSVALAREFTRRAALNCDYRGSHEDLVLVVSEFVTNAVRHGTGLPFVRIAGGSGNLLVEVTDDSGDRPRRRRGGWGIQLIERLGTAWGVAERDGRKIVWCELSAQEP